VPLTLIEVHAATTSAEDDIVRFYDK